MKRFTIVAGKFAAMHMINQRNAAMVAAHDMTAFATHYERGMAATVQQQDRLLTFCDRLLQQFFQRF